MTKPDRRSLSAPSSDNEQPDWSQISETLTLLALAVSQIDTSLHESSDSINQLTQQFSSIADSTQQLLALSDSQQHPSVRELAEHIQASIGQSVVSFQFYDRLCQRLEHVSDSLEHMGHLIASPTQRYQRQAWQALQQDIKSNYTMEAERLMYEYILSGHSIAEALQIYRHHFETQGAKPHTDDNSDEIEFF
ncbi:hypothetical protein GCM10011297_28350 [Bacterioplanes sanyensis]|uniref:hypothetical protein n=1 Tax=Bacterioplanes sanyensis TaxID=1249553 RepID=UPI00167560F2|nr:hypothetical protein [Bacterioplanes sanyensis]GGY53932.1 hypothetical protein GCM10011297_28350 [Bacterioplanes sanyensis]